MTIDNKPKRIRTPAKKEHYVNNKVFLEAMIEYKDKCNKAKKRGRKNPVSYTHLTLPTKA